MNNETKNIEEEYMEINKNILTYQDKELYKILQRFELPRHRKYKKDDKRRILLEFIDKKLNPKEGAEKFVDYYEDRLKHKFKVSSLGKIYSKNKQKYVKTFVSNGYNIIILALYNPPSKQVLRVDQVIIRSFFGLENNGDVYLEHIDGNNLNDELSNLRWINIFEYLKCRYGGIWKRIENNEKYFISTDGLVWSMNIEELMRLQEMGGYYSVGFCVNCIQTSVRVHRLVAQTFMENPDNLPFVNHKDGNKVNNKLENLEWCNEQQNSQHAVDNLPRKERTYHEECDPPEDAVVIDGHPEHLVTRDGKIYSNFNRRFLKFYLINGYHSIKLRSPLGKYFHYFVHGIVAKNYLPIPEPGKIQVNHKNMDRLDNRVENLEWCTRSENVIHSKINNPGQYKDQQKKVAQLDRNTEEVIRIFEGINYAAKNILCKSSHISEVCKGKRSTAGGFKWKYV